MFTNCLTYNPPEYEIHLMAKSLQQLFLGKISFMPQQVSVPLLFQNFQLVFGNCCLFNNPEDDIVMMCRNVENIFKEKSKYMPPEV